MSNARQLAANLPRDGGLSNRNLIINGAMQVAQRGTSFTADNVFTLDRWKSSDGTGGSPARTASQEEFTLGQIDVPNARYYFRHNQTGASTNSNSALQQKIEDVTRFDGTTITLSFYAKASAELDMYIRFIQDFGTGGSPSSDVTLSETITIGTTWQKYTVTKTLGSLSGKTLGTDGEHTSFLNLNMDFQTASTFTFEATLFQLEYGDTATPFEHRSYGDELARCQRYFKRFETTGNEYQAISAGVSYISSLYLGTMNYHPEMRTVPSFTTNRFNTNDFVIVGGNNTYQISSVAITGNGQSTRLQCDTSGMPVGDGAYLQLKSTGGYVDFDAEL